MRIVDGMLLHIARSHEDAEPKEQVGAQKIEQSHNIRLRFISRWNVVEKVRDDANATKHRLGTTLVYHSGLGINELRNAKLRSNDADDRIQVVDSWLREIIRVTEKNTI